jgi:hypothetical protein
LSPYSINMKNGAVLAFVKGFDLFGFYGHAFLKLFPILKMVFFGIDRIDVP